MNEKNEITRQLEITTKNIELYKILKVEGMVSSGAIAKNEIASGLVKVNGNTETRKRKKIIAGDIVEYLGEHVRIY
jgi:ribosome-associated protein